MTAACSSHILNPAQPSPAPAVETLFDDESDERQAMHASSFVANNMWAPNCIDSSLDGNYRKGYFSVFLSREVVMQ